MSLIKEYYSQFDNYEGGIPYKALSGKTIAIVGAGALGNAVCFYLQHLVLDDSVTLIITDFDKVERLNGSRSPFFLDPTTIGLEKAKVLSDKVKEQNPELNVIPIVSKIEDVGEGIFRKTDVILMGLDSKMARLATSSLAKRYGIPCIDAGLSLLSGYASLYLPEKNKDYYCKNNVSPESTGTSSCSHLVDYTEKNNLLPSSILSSFICAGYQIMTLINLLNNDQKVGKILTDRKFVLHGEYNEAYMTNTSDLKKDDCPICGVEIIKDKVIESPLSFNNTVSDLINFAENRAMRELFIVPRPFITSLKCIRCNKREDVNMLKSSLPLDKRRCDCGYPIDRIPDYLSFLDRDSLFFNSQLSMFFPPFDIITLLDEEGNSFFVELSGDKERFFK